METTLPLHLAAMYSRRWSSRTFSMGWLGLATMPSRLPPYTGTTKAGSLPSSGLVDRRQRYYEPLGLPPSTIPFRHRLIGTAFARRGPPGRVSPVPYQAVFTCPPPYPVGVLHPSGSHGCSLLPSPWHERLGHPSLSGSYVTRLQGSLYVGPANLLPSQRPYGLLRAFDIPLGRQALARHPGPATRRSGAYRDGTFTRKSDTARFATLSRGESVRTHQSVNLPKSSSVIHS